MVFYILMDTPNVTFEHNIKKTRHDRISYDGHGSNTEVWFGLVVHCHVT